MPELPAPSEWPRVTKCAALHGRHLRLRDAQPEDAVFILDLRLHDRLRRFISRTDPDLHRQQRWLECYRGSSDQAYFIVENEQRRAIGTARIYSPEEDEATWGSFIMAGGVPARCSIECVLMIHAYALHLGFNKLRADIHRDNSSVWRFNELLGASRTHEREDHYHYRIDRPGILNALVRFRRYLPDGVRVDPVT